MADSILARVGEAIAITPSDRGGARRIYAGLWDAVGETGDPLHRCAIAHGMADVQDAADAELVWDLRALAAATELTNARLEAVGMGTIDGLMTSLHLNLADVYRRTGDAEKSRAHIDAAHGALAALPGDQYAQMIRASLDRISSSLAGPHVHCAHCAHDH